MGRAKGNVHAIATPLRSQTLPFYEPAGPEMTDEDILAHINRHSRADQSEEYQASQLARFQNQRDNLKEVRVELPSRRSLEAVLAAVAGEEYGSWRMAHRHLPWSALYEMAEGIRHMDTSGYNSPLSNVAKAVEEKLRWRVYSSTIDERVQANVDARALAVPDDETLERLRAKVAAGALSGDVADYSRAELRKLLGLLEREAKSLTTDDLAGIAQTGGLIPKFASSPSHFQLALNNAIKYGKFDEKKYRQGIRMSYKKLLDESNNRYANDDGTLQDHEILKQMQDKHPLLVASNALHYKALREIAAHTGINVTADAKENKIADDAQTKQQSPLDLVYSQTFSDFARSFNPDAKLGKVHRTLGDGQGSKRGLLAVYYPGSGDIYMRASLADSLRSKTASEGQISVAVQTVAHEIFHGTGKRDYGNSSAGTGNESTPEFTLDEGTTESLARLHSQRLATEMGLWSDAKGKLPTSHGAYPGEVQTAVVLAAYFHGELDKEKLREGEYAQPHQLSDRAQYNMLSDYVEYGLAERIKMMSEQLAYRKQLGEDEATDIIRTALTLCKTKGEGTLGQRLAAILP